MEKIKVAFDDQIFMAQKRGGVSKYFVELFANLPKFGVEVILLSEWTANQHLVESGRVTEKKSTNNFLEKVRYFSWRQFGGPSSTPKVIPNFDILHHTFTNDHYLKIPAGKRVSTIHDMTPELHPEYFPFGNPHLAKKEFCERSDGLIAISGSTQTDLCRIYSNIQLKNVEVIHHGIENKFFSSRILNIDLPTEFLLFVGVRRGYKDFELALEAFSYFHKEHANLKLLCVGGGPFSSNEKQKIEKLGLTESVIQKFPTDFEIVEIYRNAKALIFPSHYEGFGFPILEAMAVGTPVVLAENSCMKEIGGEFALYFETGNLEQAMSQLKIALNPEYQNAFAPNMVNHAREFTVEKTAEKTSNFYRKILQIS